MEIGFYDMRMNGHHAVLVKEKNVAYGTEKSNTPELAVEMINKTTSLNVMGEECCYMTALDNVGRPLGIFFIAKGAGNMCLVSSRAVFMRALLIGATSIIFFHNHPSGECTPSMEDTQLTKNLKEAGELLGIPLSDHIILGGENYFSFKEHEML